MAKISKAIGAAVGGILGVAVAYGLIGEDEAAQAQGAISTLVEVLLPVIFSVAGTYIAPANAPAKP